MGVVKLVKTDKKLWFCVDSWRDADRNRFTEKVVFLQVASEKRGPWWALA